MLQLQLEDAERKNNHIAESSYFGMKTFHGMRWDFGYLVSVHNLLMKEQRSSRLLKYNPAGRRAARTSTSHASVNRPLQEQQLHYYEIQLVSDDSSPSRRSLSMDLTTVIRRSSIWS